MWAYLIDSQFRMLVRFVRKNSIQKSFFSMYGNIGKKEIIGKEGVLTVALAQIDKVIFSTMDNQMCFQSDFYIDWYPLGICCWKNHPG